MNVCILSGKVISKPEFKFVYNDGKYSHISMASFEIEIDNGSIIELIGYDLLADYMYRKIDKNEILIIAGSINTKKVVIVKEIYKR